MKKIYIYNPQINEGAGSYRGSGRIMQILKENLIDNVEFIRDLKQTNHDSTLFIPSWSPFQPSRLDKRIAKRQILLIFDVIPLKYPSHFPIGIKGTINSWRNKQALKYVDKIITISEHSKKDLMQYLKMPEEKVTVVYPSLGKVFLKESVIASGTKQSQVNVIPAKAGIYINRSPIRSGMTNDKIAASPDGHRDPQNDIDTIYDIPNTKYVLYVGDVNWNKNLVNLAKAIKKANIPCVFAGKMFSKDTIYDIQHTKYVHVWLREFKQFLEEVGNDKRFIFLGYVPDNDLITLYQNAICNILVSRDEGFGYSYAEAASQKCPSVLSDTDIFHETACGTALFANPESPDDIASKITDLAANEAVRNELGKKAFENASKMYHPDSFTRQLDSVFVE